MAKENPYNLSAAFEKAERLDKEAQSLVDKLKQSSSVCEKKEILDRLYKAQFNNYLTHVGIRNEMQKSLKDMPTDFYQDVKAGIDGEERALLHLQKNLENIQADSNTLSIKLL